MNIEEIKDEIQEMATLVHEKKMLPEEFIKNVTLAFLMLLPKDKARDVVASIASDYLGMGKTNSAAVNAIRKAQVVS